jgi:1-aminocyclopropane-1-carboxylate deaminase/D-cysteine desulfhydrase-like pyridoxal-dependent ACC family enzyme
VDVRLAADGVPGDRLPRFRLGAFPTPLVRAERLERAAGCRPLLVKRDDLAGFGVAGNKSRPLEYLIGDACARGVEVVVGAGGAGSNFCPALAMAASTAGLACELVVWGEPEKLRTAPNLAMAAAAGAVLRPTGDTVRERVDELAAARAAELVAAGRRAQAIPRGGSTPVGAVGFARAAAELMAQVDAPPPDVVVPVGSGGTCAGLLAGFAALGVDTRVVGVSVSRPPAEIAVTVHDLAQACAALLGTAAPRPAQLHLVDARGAGFGTASAGERAAADLALRTEGLFFDHTYGAEALAVALDLVRDRTAGRAPVLLWHTGGLVPAVASLTTDSQKGT